MGFRHKGLEKNLVEKILQKISKTRISGGVPQNYGDGIIYRKMYEMKPINQMFR